MKSWSGWFFPGGGDRGNHVPGDLAVPELYLTAGATKDTFGRESHEGPVPPERRRSSASCPRGLQ
jgi:hypothetical protein